MPNARYTRSASSSFSSSSRADIGHLKQSPLVRLESATYRKESDLLGEFLDEKTTTDADSRVTQAQLFSTYRLWHESNGTRPGSKNTFTKKLAERGYGTAKSNGERFYTGVKLTSSSTV